MDEDPEPWGSSPLCIPLDLIKPIQMWRTQKQADTQVSHHLSFWGKQKAFAVLSDQGTRIA